MSRRGPVLPKGPDTIRVEGVRPEQWGVLVRDGRQQVRVNCVTETAARNFAQRAQRIGVVIEDRFVSDPTCDVIAPEA